VSEEESSAPRRDFLKDSGKNAIRLASGTLSIPRARTAPAAEPSPGWRAGAGLLRPPGALEEAEFLATCDSCHRCVEACPADCIVLFEDGNEAASGTPYILPEEKGCTMCLDCGAACPTGALATLTRMEDVIMGTAVIDPTTCVSLNGTGVCGACHTICPLRNRAITLDYRDAPTVNIDECTGCGLCEEICFVEGTPAIRIFTEREPLALDKAGSLTA
jgi:ferredoxin-type protein NapG